MMFSTADREVHLSVPLSKMAIRDLDLGSITVLFYFVMRPSYNL